MISFNTTQLSFTKLLPLALCPFLLFLLPNHHSEAAVFIAFYIRQLDEVGAIC